MNIAEYRREREQDRQEAQARKELQEQRAHLGRAEWDALILDLIQSDPTEPMEPLGVPFQYLPEEIREELEALPQGHEDIGP